MSEQIKLLVGRMVDADLITDLPGDMKMAQEIVQRAIDSALAEKNQRIAELEAWKESAIKVMPDFQEIGRLMGLPLGADVAPKIIPWMTQRIALPVPEPRFQQHAPASRDWVSRDQYDQDLAQARAEALREAVEICRGLYKEDAWHMFYRDAKDTCADAILAIANKPK